MRHRTLTVCLSTVVVATAASSLMSRPLAAQSPRRAANAAPVVRNPDGHPDLQGTYDVATMTPLERPAGLGDRLVLTREEAAALEKYEEDRQIKNDAPLKPDREAPPVGGEKTTPKSFLEVLERFGGGAVGGYNNFWLAGGTRIISVNGEKRSSIIVDPADGRIPAMKPDAQKRNAALPAAAASPDANEGAGTGPAGAFDDPERRPLAERCLLGVGSTSGPPTLPNYLYNNLKQIVQTPDSIMMLNEMVHDAPVTRMK